MIARFANPHRFMALSTWLLPLLSVISLGCIAYSYWQGLFVVPPIERQGGEVVRMLYAHVPMAWLAMGSYVALALSSFIWYIWRHDLADIAAKSIAPIGALFTFLCLVTGAVWGKPTWGTWWQWDDPRMMSVLVMFFLFLGYMVLRDAMPTRQKAAKAGAIMAMIGALNLPIIRFSVDFVTSLHQPATVITLEGPKMDAVHLVPLLVGGIGYSLLFSALVMTAMRTEIYTRRAAILRRKLLEREA